MHQATSIVQAESTKFAVFRISAMGDTTYGLEACHTFWEAGYKLQILSSSHLVDGHNPYPPNTYLKTTEQVQDFLQHGTGLSEDSSTLFHMWTR